METFSASLVICAGNSPAPGEFPAQRPVTRSLDVFFDLHPNKRLSKRWWGWWFETPSCPLWRHRKESSRLQPGLTQRWPNVDGVVPKLDQRWPKLHRCLGSGSMRYLARLLNHPIKNTPFIEIRIFLFHYSDVIMSMIASQITSLTIVYWTIYSDADQRKHQSSASRACMENSPGTTHKWPVTRQMFPFDDVIMLTKSPRTPIYWSNLLCPFYQYFPGKPHVMRFLNQVNFEFQRHDPDLTMMGSEWLAWIVRCNVSLPEELFHYQIDVTWAPWRLKQPAFDLESKDPLIEID